MTISRGLAALILTLVCFTAAHAEFLYKDDVVHMESFAAEIEKIGAEVREKTGIGIYVAVIKELDANQTLADYENAILDQVQEPALVLTLSEYDQQIDIMARPASLYKDFDKEQILSFMPNRGTILPILTMKSKKATTAEKFAAAIQNGYTDIAEQIADSRDVKLVNAVGSSNKTFFNVLRVFFYGMIAYALFMLIRRKISSKRRIDE